MSLREWLILIGVLLIVGVFADGYRRVRIARKRASEINFGLEEVKGGDPDLLAELPNGGARPSPQRGFHVEGNPKEVLEPSPLSNVPTDPILSVDDYTDDFTQSNIEESTDSALHFEQPLNHSRDEFELSVEDSFSAYSMTSNGNSAQRKLDLDDPVPILMNVDEPRSSGASQPSPIEGAIKTENSKRTVRSRDAVKLSAESDGLMVKSKVTVNPNTVAIQERDVAERINFHRQKELSLETGDKTEKLKDRPPANEVIVINVLSKGGGVFSGEKLMQSLLDTGMRFGDMSIFHRYSNTDGTGKIMFSLANGVKPGTFAIDNLEATQTPALSLFMSLPGPDEPMYVFAAMEETARRLALDLGGELKDEQLSVMTQQTLEYCRQRIREYERKQLARQPVY